MIDVINLRKNFGDVEVLKGIDIKINKGDIVAVIGASGSGKSTFLRCLNCMEDPTGGSIIFRGVDIADMKVDINEHRQHMGMVFQHFNLFNNKTVLQNIMLAPVHVRCKALKKWNKENPDNKKTKKDIKAEEKERAMALLKRISNDPYLCVTDIHDVSEIANEAKSVPRSMINENGDNVTEEFLDYVRPLVQGEVSQLTVNGLPMHIKDVR